MRDELAGRRGTHPSRRLQRGQGTTGSDDTGAARAEPASAERGVGVGGTAATTTGGASGTPTTGGATRPAARRPAVRAEPARRRPRRSGQWKRRRVRCGSGSTGGDGGMGGRSLVRIHRVRRLSFRQCSFSSNSSSMFETMPPSWPNLKSALMDADGPVQALQTKIRFGFVSYKGSTAASTEGGPLAPT